VAYAITWDIHGLLMANYCDVRLSYMVFPGAVEKSRKILNELVFDWLIFILSVIKKCGFET
jgi:hypothetical protein